MPVAERPGEHPCSVCSGGTRRDDNQEGRWWLNGHYILMGRISLSCSLSTFFRSFAVILAHFSQFLSVCQSCPFPSHFYQCFSSMSTLPYLWLLALVSSFSASVPSTYHIPLFVIPCFPSSCLINWFSSSCLVPHSLFFFLSLSLFFFLSHVLLLVSFLFLLPVSFLMLLPVSFLILLPVSFFLILHVAFLILFPVPFIFFSFCLIPSCIVLCCLSLIHVSLSWTISRLTFKYLLFTDFSFIAPLPPPPRMLGVNVVIAVWTLLCPVRYVFTV